MRGRRQRFQPRISSSARNRYKLCGMIYMINTIQHNITRCNIMIDMMIDIIEEIKDDTFNFNDGSSDRHNLLVQP